MKTNRFRQCFAYKTRSLSIPSLIFLGVFILARFVLPLLLHFLAGDSASISFSMNGIFSVINLLSLTFVFSAMIFMFVGGVASFREEFNHLLVMNNTRSNQFWAGQLAQVVVIACMTIASLVFGLAEQLADSAIKGEPLFAEFGWIYSAGGVREFAGGLLSGLALFFTILLLAYAFGETAGILSYRIGRAFILPFWICFGLAFVLVPILSAGNNGFTQFLGWYFGRGSDYPLLATAWHFLATTVILKGVSYLTVRRLPQNTAS